MEELGSSRAVLIVAHRFSLGFGGVPESILLLARELATMGIRVDVLTKDGISRDAGTLSGLPSSGTALSLGEIGRIKLEAYGCLLVAGAWNPVACWLAARARGKGIRIVYTPKGNLARAEFKRLRDAKKLPYLLTLELGLLSMSDRIIFSSDLERRHSLATLAFAAKSTVVPEPFVGPVLQPERSRPPGYTRFGFMAEIAPRKGLAELVEAFITLQGQGRLAAELHIAGGPRPGSESYYEAVRERAGLASRPEMIIFHGPLRGNQRDEFYEDIDFFVCPTRFESFGLTPLEALWHGRPVMVTENLGVLEFISDLECIVSLGQGSPGEMLTALGAAMAARDRYLETAKHWRMRAHPRLSDRQLAVEFSRELGVERLPRQSES